MTKNDQAATTATSDNKSSLQDSAFTQELAKEMAQAEEASLRDDAADAVSMDAGEDFDGDDTDGDDVED